MLPLTFLQKKQNSTLSCCYQLQTFQLHEIALKLDELSSMHQNPNRLVKKSAKNFEEDQFTNF